MKTTKTNTYFDNPGIRRTVQYLCLHTRLSAERMLFPAVSVGGTEEGADTVLVIRPSHIASFFDLQVREVVAMPRNR